MRRHSVHSHYERPHTGLDLLFCLCYGFLVHHAVFVSPVGARDVNIDSGISLYSIHYIE